MINSDFDTIIRNDNNFQNNGKGKVKIIITILIFVILFSIGGVGYLYYSKYQENIPKIKFFEYLDDTNIDKIVDTTMIRKIINKIETSSHSMENEITIDSQNENFKLPTIKVNLQKNDLGDNSIDLIVNKSAEQDIIKFKLLHDSENIGVKSDDIVIKYIGGKKNNLSNLVKKINSTNLLQEESGDNLPNSQIEIPNKVILEKYKNIINSKLTEDKFSIEKNVLLTQNESSMETTLYELKLSKEEVLELLTELKNQIINDPNLINCWISGKEAYNEAKIDYNHLINGEKMDYTLEQIVEIIEVEFNKLYSNILKIEKFDYLYLDIYVNNDNVVKKSIKIGEYIEINIEEQKKSVSENYAKVSMLFSNDSNQKDAILFNINRLDNNVSTIFDIELSTTKSSKINNKISINMTLEGNVNSTNLTNKVSAIYSNETKQIKANLNSKVQIGYDGEVEKLNSEICLFLDELDIITLKDVIGQVSTKAREVANVKKEEFLREDTNEENNNIVNELIDMDGETDEEARKEVQDKLVKKISEEMSKAEQEGREYALIDLQTLQIEGSTVSVMVDENMAIVAIDGYTFSIDPNFVLTTE